MAGRSTKRAIVEVFVAPLVYLAATILLWVRRTGLESLPLCRRALLRVGIMPIRNHYYEPLFDRRSLRKPTSDDRALPGIDWNVEGQLALLEAFAPPHELESVPSKFAGDRVFHFDNGAFDPGDAEYWYDLIRLKKPRRIIEIGSGHSTKMARLALEANAREDGGHACEHICIEPFEMPWLESLGVTVVREKVENVDPGIFQQLGSDDILFIDSSHIIRPQGDVLFEYLEVLPTLAPGVIVHVHDIFSPKDYPEAWLFDRVQFWNEQYLLEAFLTQNSGWKVLGALNYLRHHHYDALRSKCPRLTPRHEPGSFYMVRTG